MRNCLQRGEAPFASHLLYTQPGILADEDPGERALGIDAGLAWGRAAAATVVYCDLGISKGMEQGIAAARAEGAPGGDAPPLGRDGQAASCGFRSAAISANGRPVSSVALFPVKACQRRTLTSA